MSAEVPPNPLESSTGLDGGGGGGGSGGGGGGGAVGDGAAGGAATGDSTTTAPPPIVILIVGTAGSGKTTLVQRLCAELALRGDSTYAVNLDPAVLHLPYHANIDIRDTVNYKELMKQYKLGPNGAIVTALNLFATRFDKVVDILKARASSTRYVVVDTPGQIEVFTWSASGALITDMLVSAFPTVVLYVVDTPRCKSPTTFMSNMLYACSILYKTRLPFVAAFNKADIAPPAFAAEWMDDYAAFQAALDEESERSESYSNSLTRSLSLSLDEFYRELRHVGVSSLTGEGFPELLSAVRFCARAARAKLPPPPFPPSPSPLSHTHPPTHIRARARVYAGERNR
jgi:GTPase SAR1 family protein